MIDKYTSKFISSNIERFEIKYEYANSVQNRRHKITERVSEGLTRHKTIH